MRQCKYKCKMGIKIVNKCLAADCDNIMVMWTIGVELEIRVIYEITRIKM